jgi:hypothetical protein
MKNILMAVLMAASAGAAYAEGAAGELAALSDVKTNIPTPAAAVEVKYQVPSDKIQIIKTVSGNVAGMIPGVLLEDPNVDGLHFLAISGEERMNAYYYADTEAAVKAVVELRAIAACHALKLGDALLSIQQTISDANLLTVTASGRIVSMYAKNAHPSTMKVFYSSYIKTLICAVK